MPIRGPTKTGGWHNNMSQYFKLKKNLITSSGMS